MTLPTDGGTARCGSDGVEGEPDDKGQGKEEGAMVVASRAIKIWPERHESRFPGALLSVNLKMRMLARGLPW